MSDALLREWNLAPFLLVALGTIASAYAFGTRRLAQHLRRQDALEPGRGAAFWTGLLVLAIAVISPLDALARETLAARTVQHTLIALLAAPLLVLGSPVTVVQFALPARIRLSISRASERLPWISRGWSWMSQFGFAWLFYAVTLWLWHLPGLHAAALASGIVHNAMHVSLLVAGLLLWRSLIRPAGQTWSGKRILQAFATALHSVALGVLLTVSPQPWYTAYADAVQWRLSPLEDQQLAGLVIWISGGLVYVIAGLALVVAWLDAVEHDIKQKESVAQQEYQNAGALTAAGLGQMTASSAQHQELWRRLDEGAGRPTGVACWSDGQPEKW